MEDIDGGLHPAVDGQSLDEDEDEEQAAKYNILFSDVWKKREQETKAMKTKKKMTKKMDGKEKNEDDRKKEEV